MKTLSQAKAAYARSCRGMNVLRLASNVADGETVTIGSEVYEIDTAAAPGAITAGNIRVDCNAGVTPTIASAALVAAINANNTCGIQAEAVSVNEILISTRDNFESSQIACAETLAGANNVWAAVAMYGCTDAVIPKRQMVKRAAIAQEVTIGTMHFVFPFVPTKAFIGVRSSTGVHKAWGGTYAITNGRLTLTNTGSTDFAATDVVTVYASE